MERIDIRLAVVLGWALACAAPASAQRDLKNIPDPDPELERRSFQVADGFEVNLFAADPLLNKPIAMNFDSAGRLWVVSSEVYPQIKPGQQANDRIIILEDRDGDGRADRTTVFADGLLIPTGLAPGDGGVYVADSTDLLHLSDTDGDGRADRRRVVLSGFGTEDTHHILHTLRWGPDGMLYFNQSIYIHSHIETPHGVRRLNAGGVWQFRPETMELEVFLHGFCNPWGHHFDRWGQSFVTDGAYGEGINYGLPGASYVFTPGAARILAGLNPGSPKHCGEEVLSGRHLPDDWRGNVLTNDFRGHRVCRFVLREDGSAYASQENPELIKTDHAAFRPVDVKMGPDGAIYIADWYNPIIQHGEVDFRDPRRDHTHGRIWRVTAKNRPLVPRPQLVNASTENLLEALKAPEDWTRLHAKRVLKERGRAVVLPALSDWLRRLDPADAEYEHHLLEGLWTYQSLDVAAPELLETLLTAKDHHARAAATRVLQHWHQRVPNALAQLTARVADDHPQVRLEAVRALARIPSPRAAEVALRALDRPMDKFLDYAVWLTARELEPFWLPAIQQGRIDFEGKVDHLLFALQAIGSSAAVKPLVEMVRTGKVSGDRTASVLTLIGGLGDANDLALVFDLAMRSPAEEQPALLHALEQAARQRSVRPAGELDRVGQLLTSGSESTRAVAARLIGAWHLESQRESLTQLASQRKTPTALRRAALEGLAGLGGPASRDSLERLSEKAQPQDLRELAVMALAAVDLERAASRLPELWAGRPPAGEPTEVFAAFLQRKSGAALLAARLAGQSLPADVARAGIRAVRATGREAPALVEALTKAGGLTAGPRVLSPAELQAMVAEVQQQGNAARGEVLFRRKDLACLKCHAIAGAGGQVGPDLVSIGASAQIDYLIESILLPNKAVKENYHSLVVTTKDGRFFTGIKVRETPTDLVLRDAEDRELAIPLKSIEDKQTGGSIMPEGLADSLSRGELLDLVRFLSELGKLGPYTVSKAPLVRRWQVLEPTGGAYQLLARTRHGSVTSGDPALVWSPAYSTVAGILPLDALPVFAFRKPSGTDADRFGFVRCQVEATTGGKVKAIVDSPAGLTVWLDQTPLETRGEMVLDLAPGLHTLTLGVNFAERTSGLRLELSEVPGSAARVHVIGGK